MSLAPASSADVTIGANVTQSTLNSGTCGYKFPTERPCTLITSAVPGQTMNAPCAGTVTRFRLNGFVRPANHYRLRVVRRNADGSFTGTASSAQVSIASEGVNEYATSLPIAAGEQIGIDFLDSTEEFGLRWVESPGVGAAYFYAFPADGGSAFPTGPATFYYLFNADIACAPANPAPGPAPAPSNKFKVVKLKATTLTLELASAGAVTVTDASAKAKAKASASKKAKPKLLKPSSASGGPGQAQVKLKLTGAAKKTLKAKGKVKVKAKITFTPTGGTASTQVKTLTVKTPRPKPSK
ncbi:MAG TPA: hypothetical protein VH042_10460 [Solirubrobacterales bacterium]|nr:hypothetical protein [Solirubrobacterales bacterium]